MERDKDNKAVLGEEYVHKKKRYVSLSLEKSAESPSKKQTILNESLSFEERTNEDKGNPGSEQTYSSKKRKKNSTLENRDGSAADDTINEVESLENVETCNTSTPKKKKKKLCLVENELNGKLVSESEGQIVTTRASQNRDKSSTFVVPCNDFQLGLNSSKDGDVSESLDSVDGVVKSKKHTKRKENKEMLDDSLNSSDLSGIERARGKDIDLFNSLDPYTVNVFESQSDVSFEKKRKRKHKEGGEGFLSTDSSIVSQSCNDTEHDNKSKRRKRDKNNQSLEEDGTHHEKGQCCDEADQIKNKENISGSTNQEGQHKEAKKSKKEKKRGRNGQSCEENGTADNKNECSGKKGKSKDKENISGLTNQESLLKKVKKSKKEKKKVEREKKKQNLQSLLKNYEFKSEDKAETSTRRTHSVLLDEVEKGSEKDTEKKTKSFDSTDLSFAELLEDVKDKSRLGDDDIEKLSTLEVMLPWKVSPLHAIETRVAGRPKATDREKIKKLGVQLRTGPFNHDEDKKIRSNWRRFHKLHDLSKDPTPFLNFTTADGKVIIPSEARIRFVRFLAHGLRDRLLCSVYNRFKRLFLQKKLNSGRFTPEEDKIIVQFLNDSTSRKPYSDLAKILNRSKLSVEKRCSVLADKVQGSGAPLKWKRGLIEEFLKHFVDITKVDDVEELKDRNVTPEEWKQVSDRLDIPAEKLRHAWFYSLYSRIFVKERLYTGQIKEKLIQRLIERDEDDWKTVDWKEIGQEFEGFTGKKLNRMMKDIVSYHCPSKIHHDLKASLNYLQDAPLKLRKIRGHKVRRLKILDRRQPEDKKH